MLRPTFAAMLGAAFGAVAIAPVRERCLDALLPNPEASAVGFVAGATALICLFVLSLREPAPRKFYLNDPWPSDGAEPGKITYLEPGCILVGGHRPKPGGKQPTPPTGGTGVSPPRDAAGRFVRP